MIKRTKRLIYLFLVFTLVFASSCDILTQVASTVDVTGGTKLTTDQVAQGLKEALKVGTDAAVKKLNATDGYYLDQIVKINLPPQTQELVNYIQKVPGLDKMVSDLVLQINRSAEDAARQAAPVFVNAITSMTIGDAWGILNGADTAATGYLREKTFVQLTGLYQPTVKTSLDKPLVAGVSANQTWDKLSKRWNQFAGSVAGKLLSVKPLNFTLDEYVTKQALRGLFVKVADQEKLIRTDINARTSDLLKKVFGSR
jgi:hypothetical protein